MPISSAALGPTYPAGAWSQTRSAARIAAMCLASIAEGSLSSSREVIANPSITATKSTLDGDSSSQPDATNSPNAAVVHRCLAGTNRRAPHAARR